MPTPYEPVSVSPRQGGALNTQDSPEDVGAPNYVLKRDWRRSFDAEIRREGDLLFQPDSAALNNQPYPESGTPITLVHTCRRANGQSTVIVGTQTTLYRYFSFNDGNVYDNSYLNGTYLNESADWYVIGQNFSTNGHRWEAVDVAGYTILNNGVDLPVAYDISKRYVEPLYELREQGIAAVGTITSFNGMLLCQDITNMTTTYTTTVLTGVSSGVITASQSGTTVTAGSSFFTSSMVGQTIVFATGQSAKILSYSSGTSVTVDTTQGVSSSTFRVAILFGIADDPDNTSRNRYQLINSNVGDPTAFGSLSTAVVTAGSPLITFPQPMYSLSVGDNVTITGAGIDNGAFDANILAIDEVNRMYIYVDTLPVESTDSVTLSVTATARSGSLSYQWMYNGSILEGATSASLVIPSVTDLNAGNYTCTIYDATGFTSTTPLTLTVYEDQPPVIVTQPASVVIAASAATSFSVVVQSGDSPSYQWNFNGAPIPGANGSIFTIPVSDMLMNGLYQCTITNAEGSTTSSTATLYTAPQSTWVTPTINAQPSNTSINLNQNGFLQCLATGVPDVSYQWQVYSGSSWGNVASSVHYSGITSSILQFITITSGMGANYRCIVTNANGSVTSSTATITVVSGGTGPLLVGLPTISQAVIFSPANVTVQNSTYPGSAISSQNLQDDGSAILRSLDLRGTLVLFKETTIFIGTFTGTAGGPIAYQKVYSGPDCLYWKWMLSEIDGTYIVYATQKDFFTFDLTLLLPRKHPQLRACSNVFYGNGLTESNQDQCYSTTNELTREVWFMFPGSTDAAICFDYEWNTCSTLGITTYTAAGTIELPTATEEDEPKKIFAIGDSSGTMRTYGLDTETGSTFQRNGSNYPATLTGGLVSFGDEYGEKDLRAYIAFCRDLAPFTVTLYGTRNAHEPVTTLCTETITSPTYQTLIATYFRYNYFQDNILVTGTSENCSIVRRLFDASKIDSRSTIKHM